MDGDRDILEEKLHDPTASAIPVPFQFLKDITCNFSNENEIGKGGFGIVYKGVLRGGKIIAVKKLYDTHLVDDDQFQRETTNQWNIEHKNIVRLVAYCAESSWEAIKLPNGNSVMAQIPKRLLCFEYLHNKSLDRLLSDKFYDLEWNWRYDIIKGICSGLDFLHRECHIAHLDIKPANILMDDAMIPKITDFGFSRLLSAQKSQTYIHGSIAGSMGYMAPEYMTNGIVSRSADIFSFGVIIIELITGQKDSPMIHMNYDENHESYLQQYKKNELAKWRKVFEDERKYTFAAIYTEQVKQCITIALQCMHPDSSRRPDTSEILEILTGEIFCCQTTLLSVQPFLLRFHFKQFMSSSCLQLTNNTEDTVAFRILTDNRENYFVGPLYGLLLPKTMYTLSFEMRMPLNDDRFTLQLRSTVASNQYQLPDVEASDSAQDYESFFQDAMEESRDVQEMTLFVHIVKELQLGSYWKDEVNDVQEDDSRHMELNVLELIVEGRKEPTKLDFQLLESITENFSDKNKIGSGGCGDVYKGVLRNGVVAVKRLFKTRTIKDKMFHREVKSLITVKHKNIVQFLGYCSITEELAIQWNGQTRMLEVRERLLCFEYISNGSLERYLTDELRGPEWHVRYQIIVGICEGLFYLHNDMGIIHMDLKPENILLDDLMVPKITDFGLSRIDTSSKTTATVLVSLGYCAPEYLHEGKASSKADIYSLGAMILELVTGSKKEPNNTKVLRRWGLRWIKSGMNQKPLGYLQVKTCLDLALRCMQEDPKDRPDISNVVDELKKINNIDEKTEINHCLDDMLDIEPWDMHLPNALDKQMSSHIELINNTKYYIVFRITKAEQCPLHTEPNQGIVPPHCKRSVTLTMPLQDNKHVHHHYREELTIQSTRIDETLITMDITGGMFAHKEDKVIDEVNVIVTIGEPPLPDQES